MSELTPATSVTILGEEYWIRGASPEMVQQLADQVDRRFQELQSTRPTMDLKRLAVMVCLNLAEELQQERSRRERVVRKARDRARLCREALQGSVPNRP